MARDLINTFLRWAVAGALGLSLGLPPAWALGPKAPFEAPRALAPLTHAQAADVAASGGAPVADGVTGLRLRHHPMALIDGHWARVGDNVRGARLESIRTSGALLRHTNGRVELLPWNAMPDPDKPSARTSAP